MLNSMITVVIKREVSKRQNGNSDAWITIAREPHSNMHMNLF